MAETVRDPEPDRAPGEEEDRSPETLRAGEEAVFDDAVLFRPSVDVERGAVEYVRPPPDELCDGAEYDWLPPDELLSLPEDEDPEPPLDEAPPPPLGPPASIGNDRTRRTEAKNAADETKAL